jgi:RNase H-fold protein (predicted Holliday junction resolvase)
MVSNGYSQWSRKWQLIPLELSNWQVGTTKNVYFSKVIYSVLPIKVMSSIALILFILFGLLISKCACVKRMFLPARPGFEMFRSRISVDYGPRVIGIAAGLGINCKPLGDISNTGNLTLISCSVLEYAKREGAVEILVGLPIDHTGTMSYNVKNLNGRLCLDFSSVLASVAQQLCPRVQVYLVDERYSTKEAHISLKNDRKGKRGSVDAQAACHILERYVEDKGAGSLIAQPCGFPIPQSIEYFDYDIVRHHIRKNNFPEPDKATKIKNMMKSLKEGTTSKKKGVLGKWDLFY